MIIIHLHVATMLHIIIINPRLFLLTHSQKGHHPLYSASFDGRLDCVELLLNHNAQIDLPVDVSYHCNLYKYKKELKIKGCSRDGRAKKYTNKFVGTIKSTIHPYACLLFSIILVSH